MVGRLSAIHSWNQWLVAGLALLHVVGIGVYQWGLKIDVLWPMVRGVRNAEVPADEAASPIPVALVLLGAASAAVYWLVVVFPRP